MKREIEGYPGVAISFSHRGKHKSAELTFRGSSRQVFYAATPGDSRRHAKNQIRDLRHQLRELGAKRVLH